jgi:hypothetical protein
MLALKAGQNVKKLEQAWQSSQQHWLVVYTHYMRRLHQHSLVFFVLLL